MNSFFGDCPIKKEGSVIFNEQTADSWQEGVINYGWPIKCPKPKYDVIWFEAPIPRELHGRLDAFYDLLMIEFRQQHPDFEE